MTTEEKTKQLFEGSTAQMQAKAKDYAGKYGISEKHVLIILCTGLQMGLDIALEVNSWEPDAEA